MMKRSFILFLVEILCNICLLGQNFAGMSGLLATPSADMDTVGDFRVGTYYMNNHFLPRPKSGPSAWTCQGKPYNTMDFYLSITPFKWIEIGYAFALFKTTQNPENKPKYDNKDRFFSIKIQPLSEGKYYPAIAIGCNDLIGSSFKFEMDRGGNGLFCNVYIVATKHFQPKGHDISVNLAYRYCRNKYILGWEGVVGGITWHPKWVPDLRAVVEYNRAVVNVGVDYLLWKHLFIQATMTDAKYFSGGLAFRANLF